MPETSRFRAELARCTGRSFRGRCFRVVELEAYRGATTPTLLFDLGPKISSGGQRFSPPDDHRGLYVSAQLATAGAEFADGLSAWKNGECAKHVTFDMTVRLHSVLDLTDAKVRRRIKTTKKEIQSAWEGFADLNGGTWPATWTLGHETFEALRRHSLSLHQTEVRHLSPHLHRAPHRRKNRCHHLQAGWFHLGAPALKLIEGADSSLRASSKTPPATPRGRA